MLVHNKKLKTFGGTVKLTTMRTELALAATALIVVATMTSPVFASPRVVSIIDVGQGPLSVAFSPNGKYAYVANEGDDTVSVITVATGEETSTIDVGDYPGSVAFSPNGKKAYVTNFDQDTVSVISVAKGLETDAIPVGDGPGSVAFSPNGKKAYVANSNGVTVSVITTR